MMTIKAMFVDGPLRGEIKEIPYCKILRVPVASSLKIGVDSTDCTVAPEIFNYRLFRFNVKEKVICVFSISEKSEDILFKIFALAWKDFEINFKNSDGYDL